MQKSILYALHKFKDGYVSGEQLASHLKVSRTSIWNQIDFFRKQGYVIEAHPRLGYKLTSVPDRLLPDEIQRDLQTRIIGREILAYEEIESTNDIAWELAAQGAKAGTVVFAESQTKGRGRMGRKWFSPQRKGIWFSVILRPKIHPASAALITICSATAIAETVKKYTGLETTTIKWPNDIYIKNKKAGGILIELNMELDKIKFAIVGIGLDVNIKEKDYPVALRKQATSLLIETGSACSRLALAQELLESLDHYNHLLENGMVDPVIAKWKDLSLVLGKRVSLAQGDRKLQGQALGIDATGSLILRLDNGFTEHINSGDVSLVSCCK